MATRAETLGTLLGVPPVDAASPLALNHSIKAGLSVSTVDRVVKMLAPNDATFKNRLVPKATLERRRKGRERLSVAEGDRLARIAKVVGLAMEIYRDEKKAREFLFRPHMMLGNQAPLDLALDTGPGADAVLNILGRAAYSGGV